MSVGLFRFNGDIDDDKSSIVLSLNISSEKFYQKFWIKAISDTDIKLFKDGSKFTPEQVDIVINELYRLIKWCNNNLSGNDNFKMNSTLKELIKSIPEEAIKSNEPFYIF